MPLPDQHDPEHLEAALAHVDHALRHGNIARSAARGLVYSIMETLGVLVGDPALPDQVRAGYEGLQETARELRARLESHEPPAR